MRNLHLELENLKQTLKDAEGEVIIELHRNKPLISCLLVYFEGPSDIIPKVMHLQKQYTTNRQTLQHHAQVRVIKQFSFNGV